MTQSELAALLAGVTRHVGASPLDAALAVTPTRAFLPAGGPGAVEFTKEASP